MLSCLMVIHLCAKFGMPKSTSKDFLAKTQIHGENIILIWRPKAKVIPMWHIVPWWNTHVPNMGWLCQRTKHMWPEHKTMTKTYRLTLKSKDNGIWMYATHQLMVINSCAKYDMSMLQQQKLRVGHKDMSKPINLTYRSKVN